MSSDLHFDITIDKITVETTESVFEHPETKKKKKVFKLPIKLKFRADDIDIEGRSFARLVFEALAEHYNWKYRPMNVQDAFAGKHIPIASLLEVDGYEIPKECLDKGALLVAPPIPTSYYYSLIEYMANVYNWEEITE